MNFYQSIAAFYNDIFPFNPAQLPFTKAAFSQPEECSLLDIGCGTGNLSFELAKAFKHVTAIDLDEDMLEVAKDNKQQEAQNLKFSTLNMLDIADHFDAESFDGVLCYGNTLVHLPDSETMSHFFENVNKVLKPGGKFLIQIINYDRIFYQKVAGLPTIENDRIRFVRNYHYDTDFNSLQFETILTYKEKNEQITNSIPLFPIQKDMLGLLLQSAGFGQIKFYGNFKRDALTSESIPLIIEMKKM